MIQLKSFTFGMYQENTFILHDETKKAVIIDPGNYDEKETAQITDYIESEGLILEKIINTHAHIDHVLGVKIIKDLYKLDFYLHKDDLATLKSVPSYAPNFGFNNYEGAEVDFFLIEGQEIQFGDSILEVVFVPGHAPGHVIFVNREQNLCIAGDTLFQGSIGRTDLPGGDHATLISMIKEKMFTMPDEMKVHPGHGPATSIGFEKLHNPFF